MFDLTTRRFSLSSTTPIPLGISRLHPCVLIFPPCPSSRRLSLGNSVVPSYRIPSPTPTRYLIGCCPRACLDLSHCKCHIESNFRILFVSFLFFFTFLFLYFCVCAFLNIFIIFSGGFNPMLELPDVPPLTSGRYRVSGPDGYGLTHGPFAPPGACPLPTGV